MQTNRDLDPDIVRSTYSTCEEQDIRHVFSHEEITRMKEEFFEIAADKTFKEELGKAFKAILDNDSDDYMDAIDKLISTAEGRIGGQGIKNLTVRFKELLAKTSKGYEIRKGIVYTLEDVEKGLHCFYDETGRYLGERRIAGRLQLNLLSNIKKTAENE